MRRAAGRGGEVERGLDGTLTLNLLSVSTGSEALAPDQQVALLGNCFGGGGYTFLRVLRKG